MNYTGSYTLVFDIFQPFSLFKAAKSDNFIAAHYLSILQEKGSIDYTNDLIPDLWCVQALRHKDIFTDLPRQHGKSTSAVDLSLLYTNTSLIPIGDLQLIQQKLESLSLEEADPDNLLDYDPTLRDDYRFSKIYITPFDMRPVQDKDKSIEKLNEPLKAKLLGYGVVRLFRDYERKLKTADDGNEKHSGSLQSVTGDGTMVAIIAVPSYFSVPDLLSFVGNEAKSNVSHYRIVKSQTPNRFMFLMKFRNKEKAEAFQKSYNGKNFNSMEPETCHVIIINKIVFRSENKLDKDNNQLSNIPYLLDDPFTAVPQSSEPKTLSKIPYASSQQMLLELPTCPVCLERMDASVSGLLTIPCQHTFHCKCLSKWQDDTCPICRYTSRFDFKKARKRMASSTVEESSSSNNLEESSSNKAKFDTSEPDFYDEDSDEDEDDDDDEEVDRCVVCKSTEHLWICLICGNIGCGRYDLGHAIDHYNQTSHCFAMEMISQRVWDYAGDNYVHRLVQNEVDGKLVELPLREDKSQNNMESLSLVAAEKVDKIGFEYSKMLISQLESQREFYESRYDSLLVKTAGDLQYSKAQYKELAEKLKLLTSKQKSQESSYSSFASVNKELNNKLKEEEALNGALSEKAEFLSNENKKLKEEAEELQQQVQDLMFFLESREKFKDAPDDVKEGQIVIEPTSRGRKVKRKNKK